MRKNTLVALFCLLFASCNRNDQPTTVKPNNPTHTVSHLTSLMRFAPTPGPYSQFIPLDTANKMLSSYLNSISYHSNDSDLQSLIFNADSLRKVLADTGIKNIKLMFAHSLNYINAGYANQNCGYQSGALTIIVGGYDNNGNYKYMPEKKVLEMAAPCPPNCPVSGTASGSFLSY